jgi:hypothetical protein
MIEVRHVRDNSEFRGLRADWNGLLMTSGQNNPFLTHEWLYAWWETFGGGTELYLLLFYERGSDTLVGIFPGYVRKNGWLPPVRRLRLLGSEVVTSDFLDLVVMPGKESAVCQAFLSTIEDEPELHLVELTDIPEDSPCWRSWTQPPWRSDGAHKGGRHTSFARH